MKITILDPTMCCSTGVCGTDIDDNLIHTAANVKWLKSLGHDVHRHNISNDVGAFKNYPDAFNKLQNEGSNSLPYILINDRLVMSGTYPTKSEWETFIGREFNNVREPQKASGSPSSSCSNDGCC